MNHSPLLKMEHIQLKIFGHDILHGVNFDLYKGEIHALVGEHRSGKSSLMRILIGDVRADKGTITLNNRVVTIDSPKTSLKLGIGMVRQNLTVIPCLNTVENIFSDRIPRFWIRMTQYGKMANESRRLLGLLGQEFDVSLRVGTLPTPKQQSVEIARILSLDPEIVIIDEISNRLTPKEMETLFSIMNKLRSRGKSIIYITPNLDEIFEIADRVTVMRNGYRISTNNVRDLDRMRLLRMAYSFVLDDQRSRDSQETNDLSDLFLLKGYNESLIKDLPVGLLILDSDNTIYFSNEEAKKLLSGSDLVHQPASEILKHHIPQYEDRIMTALQDRERRAWEGVPFGDTQFIKLRIIPLRDEKMASIGSVIMFEDVSLNYHINDYLTKAEKMASTAEIAAGVAHEINNPLGIIRNYVEILKRKDLSNDVQTKISKIDNELSRIVDIIGSLLSFSKVQSRTFIRLDITELIKEVIILLQHRFKEKQLRIEENFHNTPIWITGDENRLKQLFINLMVNSIDAVLQQGLISISIDTTPDNDDILITVSDNGYGIPNDIIDDIFTPFFSTKVTKKNTGLGLSICRHIVEAHKGSISVASTPGELTIFSITLPRGIT